MIKLCLGLVLGFVLGAGCRWFRIPVPAPPSFFGVAMILAITTGYLLTNRWLEVPKNTSHSAVHAGEDAQP